MFNFTNHLHLAVGTMRKPSNLAFGNSEFWAIADAAGE
jgi:hypothetical protein